ncbi:MAG: pyruvate formate-lyase-activating protein [Oscillospiraceae bacterium]
MSVSGKIHSTESFGAVDGPGVRFVVFMQGCPLRCLFCHNPDTWDTEKGEIVTSDELVKKICSYKSFIAKGGVTLSGGEPLLQPEFCKAIIDGCHENSLHVAIDTSGAIPLENSANAIEAADMLLLDIKDIDDDGCKILTGKSNANAFATLDFCEKIGRDVWIRQVLLPNYTLSDEKLHRLGEFLKPYKCVKKVELLPYHTMGLYKWKELGIKSKLDGIEPPSDFDVENARKILLEYGLTL